MPAPAFAEMGGDPELLFRACVQETVGTLPAAEVVTVPMESCPAGSRHGVTMADALDESAKRLIEAVAEAQPDLLLIPETDAWWDEVLLTLDEACPTASSTSPRTPRPTACTCRRVCRSSTPGWCSGSTNDAFIRQEADDRLSYSPGDRTAFEVGASRQGDRQRHQFDPVAA